MLSGWREPEKLLWKLWNQKQVFILGIDSFIAAKQGQSDHHVALTEAALPAGSWTLLVG